MKKVYIGVGHGGKDPGCTGNGYKEKDLNLAIAKAVMATLTRHGVDVKISRTKDQDKELVDRIAECNAYKPDLALDIHNNAGGGDGAEVYYYHGGGTSKTLATNVLTEITRIGQNSRGIKTKMGSGGQDYFGFIREISAPSVIVECAFVDNKTDVQIVATAAKQATMGNAIAKGILKTLGIAYKAAAAASAAKVMDKTGAKYGDNSVGVLALKEMLLLAKKKGVHPKGMYEDTGFGGGTKAAVNYLLKAWGYAENGIAGVNFVKRLAAEINKKA